MLSDMPSEPPFADWARISTIKPADPRTFQKNLHLPCHRNNCPGNFGPAGLKLSRARARARARVRDKDRAWARVRVRARARTKFS